LPVRDRRRSDPPAFFDTSYPDLVVPSPLVRTFVVMDEPTSVRSRRRRPPRAAGARKTATALSVATMLSLCGVLAWRNQPSATT
jgi:hypothetical protein